MAITRRNFMYMLTVRFFENEDRGHDQILSACIYHMRPDSLSYTVNDSIVYYYVHVYDWISRCVDLREVVALLNAIQNNFASIQLAQNRRRDVYRLLDHYDAILDKVPDTVRRRYVEHSIDRLLYEHENLNEVLVLD